METALIHQVLHVTENPKGEPNVCKAYWASCLFSWPVWQLVLARAYCCQETNFVLEADNWCILEFRLLNTKSLVRVHKGS